jgi:hypothetical protein
MSTLNVSQLKNASAASPAIVLAADGSATAQLSSINGGPISGARNRIINGDMRIDQRNGGASVNNATVALFPVDRWATYGPVAARFSSQQNAAGVAPPSGFSNYLGVTSLAATTPGTNDDYIVYQQIEGFNVSDLAFGTASASSVTLSFWVRSSLTGTLGGSLQAVSGARSYVFSYTISAANTWERKTITMPGDTTGTWNTTNGIGLSVMFGLGGGSGKSAAAGSWLSGNFNQVAGQASIVGTNGATFYITGVQLEAGTVATPFERRSYGQELGLCYRYCQVMNYNSIYSGSGVGTAFVATKWSTTDAVLINVPLLGTMRATPSLSKSGGSNRYVNNQVVTTLTLGAMTGTAIGPISLGFTNNTINATVGWVDDIGVVTASAEL